MNVESPEGPLQRLVGRQHERADFERWVDIERPSLRVDSWGDSEDMARAHVLEAAWLGWKAGKAAAAEDPIRALIAKHAELLADGPYAHYCYFELAFTRHTGWMAWLCSNQREQDPDRVVLANGQGSTPDEACRAALLNMPPNAVLSGHEREEPK